MSSTVAGVTFPSVSSITSPTSVYRPARGKGSQLAARSQEGWRELTRASLEAQSIWMS
eukprot:COSAG04_NODE_12928_length_628_cov_0.752363_1_plen_57_part_10